jgi:hypothetical protein
VVRTASRSSGSDDLPTRANARSAPAAGTALAGAPAMPRAAPSARTTPMALSARDG